MNHDHEVERWTYRRRGVTLYGVILTDGAAYELELTLQLDADDPVHRRFSFFGSLERAREELLAMAGAPRLPTAY